MKALSLHPSPLHKKKPQPISLPILTPVPAYSAPPPGGGGAENEELDKDPRGDILGNKLLLAGF